jgi:hypothetical protein
MTRKKPPAYDSEGFEAAYQHRGLSPAAKKFLEDKGALAKPTTPGKTTSKPPKAEASPSKPSTRKGAATSGSKSARRKPSEASSDLEGELPRRSRKARALQARHFRFPREIDAKLQDLVEYHEGTMVWVLSMLIQTEWVRTRRALRERLQTGAEPGEVTDPELGEVQAPGRADPPTTDREGGPPAAP